MRDFIASLQVFMQILAQPIFFLVTLVVLWRILRATEATLAVGVHVKRQIEVLRSGGLPDGVRVTEQVRKAEEMFPPPGKQQDEDHSG
jgi:hypothetical protein